MNYARPVEIVFKYPNALNVEYEHGLYYGWELDGQAYRFWLDRDHTKCMSVPISEVKYVCDDTSYVLLEDIDVCRNLYDSLRYKVEQELNHLDKTLNQEEYIKVLEDSIDELMEEYIE